MNYKRTIKTWRFKYGLIALLFGAIGSLSIGANAKAVEIEYQKILVEEGCFAPTKEQKAEWKEMTQEQRRVRSERCMTARNKTTQMKYGPPVFNAMFIVGLLLLIFSLVNIQSKADKMLEEMEEEEKKEKKSHDN